jgi:Mg2+/Co2+ transporter CorB
LNDIPLSMLLSLLAIMLVLSAFFTGSETSLMSINRYRLRHLVKLKHSGAIKVHNLLQKQERLLSFILLGNSFLKNLTSSLATLIAIKFYTADEVLIAATIGALTLIMLICTDMTPKTLATIKPEFFAFSAAWIYTPLLKIFSPLICVVNFLVNLLLRLMGIDVKKTRYNALDSQELKTIIAEAESVMPTRYQKMLLGILDFESATVEDIMTPRNEIIGLDIETSIEEIVQQIRASPHTQLVVYKKNIDRVVGFLH